MKTKTALLILALTGMFTTRLPAQGVFPGPPSPPSSQKIVKAKDWNSVRGNPHTGIEGQILGGTCPVGGPGVICPLSPLHVSIKVFSESGRAVTRFTSDPQGRFRVRLRPGMYRLEFDGFIARPRPPSSTPPGPTPLGANAFPVLGITVNGFNIPPGPPSLPPPLCCPVNVRVFRNTFTPLRIVFYSPDVV